MTFTRYAGDVYLVEGTTESTCASEEDWLLASEEIEDAALEDEEERGNAKSSIDRADAAGMRATKAADNPRRRNGSFIRGGGMKVCNRTKLWETM